LVVTTPGFLGKKYHCKFKMIMCIPSHILIGIQVYNGLYQILLLEWQLARIEVLVKKNPVSVLQIVGAKIAWNNKLMDG